MPAAAISQRQLPIKLDTWVHTTQYTCGLLSGQQYYARMSALDEAMEKFSVLYVQSGCIYRYAYTVLGKRAVCISLTLEWHIFQGDNRS